jgi:hypothetical protein
MIRISANILLFLFFSSQLISQEFDKTNLKDIKEFDRVALNYIPLFQMDSCFNTILDKIVADDSLRTYFRPQKTGYKFIIQKFNEEISVTVSPDYNDKIIRNQSLFGAILYKNRIILCVGDKFDLFIQTKDSIQMNYVIDDSETYWGSDSDGVLNIVNCLNQNIYFYLRDIIYPPQKLKAKKLRKLIK